MQNKPAFQHSLTGQILARDCPCHAVVTGVLTLSPEQDAGTFTCVSGLTLPSKLAGLGSPVPAPPTQIPAFLSDLSLVGLHHPVLAAAVSRWCPAISTPPSYPRTRPLSLPGHTCSGTKAAFRAPLQHDVTKLWPPGCHGRLPKSVPKRRRRAPSVPSSLLPQQGSWNSSRMEVAGVPEDAGDPTPAQGSLLPVAHVLPGVFWAVWLYQSLPQTAGPMGDRAQEGGRPRPWEPARLQPADQGRPDAGAGSIPLPRAFKCWNEPRPRHDGGASAFLQARWFTCQSHLKNTVTAASGCVLDPQSGSWAELCPLPPSYTPVRPPGAWQVTVFGAEVSKEAITFKWGRPCGPHAGPTGVLTRRGDEDTQGDPGAAREQRDDHARTQGEGGRP